MPEQHETEHAARVEHESHGNPPCLPDSHRLNASDKKVATGIFNVFLDLDLDELLAAVVEPENVADTPKGISVVYANHRGEVATRTITPLRVHWGITEYHPTPQWLLDCWDHEKDDFRTYALNKCDFMSAEW